MKTIGIVGGVASGKSTVAQCLSQECAWIEADSLVHIALGEDQIKSSVRDRFNHPKVFDAAGKINRKELGTIVFADKTELDALEAIVLPRVYELIENRILAAPKDKKAVILDFPLLFRGGYDKQCDAIWFCHLDRKARFERYLARLRAADPNATTTMEDMDRRDAMHMPLKERQERSHYVIRTDRPKEEVCSFVHKLLKVVCEPTVFSAWPNGLLLAQHAIKEAMDHERMPSSAFLGLWDAVDTLELHLREEMRRRRL